MQRRVLGALALLVAQLCLQIFSSSHCRRHLGQSLCLLLLGRSDGLVPAAATCSLSKVSQDVAESQQTDVRRCVCHTHTSHTRHAHVKHTSNTRVTCVCARARACVCVYWEGSKGRDHTHRLRSVAAASWCAWRSASASSLCARACSCSCAAASSASPCSWRSALCRLCSSSRLHRPDRSDLVASNHRGGAAKNGEAGRQAADGQILLAGLGAPRRHLPLQRTLQRAQPHR
jgi:hypothetical protein